MSVGVIMQATDLIGTPLMALDPVTNKLVDGCKVGMKAPIPFKCYVPIAGVPGTPVTGYSLFYTGDDQVGSTIAELCPLWSGTVLAKDPTVNDITKAAQSLCMYRNDFVSQQMQ
jgi:hypothetical protein